LRVGLDVCWLTYREVNPQAYQNAHAIAAV